MAIRWDDGHETVRRKNLWQLRRTPRGGELKAYIVSTTPVGVWTHYYGGKTIPCEGEHCVACQDKQNPRKHWYLACIAQATGERYLLELTDRGADSILETLEKEGSLRGRYVRTYRVNNKPNGPVESITGDLAPTHIAIPKEPDIKQCLVIIWSLDTRTETDEDGEPTTRVAGHRRRRKKKDGPRTEPNVELPKPLDAGGLRSPDDVHEQPREAGDLPPSAAAKPTEPRASLPAPENGNGRGRLVEFD